MTKNGPPTLRNLIAMRYGLLATCLACGRCERLDLGYLVLEVGPTTDVQQIGRCFRYRNSSTGPLVALKAYAAHGSGLRNSL